MPNPAAGLPAAIGAALAECALLPLPPVMRAALAELLRCVSATDPASPFRCSVAHLVQRMGRSRNTISRYLAALVAAGLVERWQVLRGSRRHGFRCALMRLTPAGLDALGLQRAPIPAHVSKPSSKGNRFTRLRRIPKDLTSLADKIGASRVVWLMSECRKRGRRLQEMSAAALQADSPAGYVLRALRGAAQHSRPAPAGRPHDTADETRAKQLAPRDAQRAVSVLGAAARARLEAWRAARSG